MKWLELLIKKNTAVMVLLLIGFFSLTVRLLNHYNFDKSALLYIGLPFITAIMLGAFTKGSDAENWKLRYWNHTRLALIVFLGSSIVLFEGFLCVLLFLPIYFFFVLMGFIAEALRRDLINKSKGKIKASLLPMVVIVASIEGVHPNLSFARYNQVSASTVISGDVDVIKENLMQPITLGDDMPWFLAMFPMPYHIEAGTLQTGDIHRVAYRYHRWFITNTHEGHMLLKITEVGNDRIKTEIIEDTSYISTYLTLHGSDITVTPLGDGQNRITITVNYDRKLDPYWYFGPIEKLAVEQAAEYLLAKVVAKNG